MWLPDTRFEAPELFIPGRITAGTKIDYTHPLAHGLKHFLVPVAAGSSTNIDLCGTKVTKYLTTSVTDDSAFYHEGVLTTRPVGSFNDNGHVGFQMDTPITSSDDVTCLHDCYIGNLSQDYGLISFGTSGGSWSWLDTSGGVLRISAYTQYDTTNTISSTGRYQIGLIWRADNSYQTIYQKEYSQSGTSSRPTMQREVWLGNTAASGKVGLHAGTQGSVVKRGNHWWGVWARSLSEAETISMFDDPYQFLVPK
jgi:hypothetical protein